MSDTMSFGGWIGFGIGFLLGGFPMATVGYSIGAWLDPPPAPDPPPLGDLGINSYVRNMPLSVSYGQNKVYGGVITMFNNSVDMENQGSSKQPNYTPVYYADFAVAVSEGIIQEYIKYFLNDKDLSELDEEDCVYLNFYPYLGTIVQDVEPAIFANDNNWVPYRNTSYIYCSGKIGKANTLPTLSSEIKGLLTESGEQDANPIKVIYDFMTNKRYGCGIDTSLFDGSPTTSGSWKDSSDFCDASVSVGSNGKIPFKTGSDSTTTRIFADFSSYEVDYWNGNSGEIEIGGINYSFTVTNQTDTYIDIDVTLSVAPGANVDFYLYVNTEARFRYSNTIVNKIKGYDFINDVLQTCRGMIYMGDGLIKILIQNNAEQPVLFFSDRKEETFIVNNICTNSRIYADFSSYSDDFWNGDLGGIVNDIEFIVLDQTATYIDVTVPNDNLSFGNLSSIPEVGISFTLVKDNIKEGTFKYNDRGTREKDNRLRIEFINRYDDYRQDIMEIEDVYDINETNEIRERTTRMEGVKRKTQAGRNVTQLLDQIIMTNFLCEFETDIVGMTLSMGCIIGVSHSSINWNEKLFRVMGMEELEDYEVKLSLVEYVPACLHDKSIPIDVTDSSGLPNPYKKAGIVERFTVINDSIVPHNLLIFFKAPENDNYWSGINLYYKRHIDSSYIFISKFTTTTPSVILDDTIDDITMEIPYDPSTMYGSFPEIGTFFIEEEEIYYGSINVLTNKFMSCTRGYNSSTAVAHDAGKYCNLRQAEITPSYLVNTPDIGVSLDFRAISMNIYDIYSTPANSPIYTITPN